MVLLLICKSIITYINSYIKVMRLAIISYFPSIMVPSTDNVSCQGLDYRVYKEVILVHSYL